jgi:hypothetical protein
VDQVAAERGDERPEEPQQEQDDDDRFECVSRDESVPQLGFVGACYPITVQTTLKALPRVRPPGIGWGFRRDHER